MSHNLSSRRLLRADTAIPTLRLPRPVVAQVGDSSGGGGGEAASLRGPAEQQPPQALAEEDTNLKAAAPGRGRGSAANPSLPKWRRLPLPPHPARGTVRGGRGRGLPPCAARPARREVREASARQWDLGCFTLLRELSSQRVGRFALGGIVVSVGEQQRSSGEDCP